MSDDSFKPLVSKVAGFIPVTDQVLADGGWIRNTIVLRMEDPTNPSTWHPPPPTRRQRIRSRWYSIKQRIIDTIDVARHGLPDRDDW